MNKIEEKVIELGRKHTDQSINVNSNIKKDLLMDSLSFISFIVSLENYYNFSLDEKLEELINRDKDISVSDIVNMIEGMVKSNEE